jgi:hypothetical protein
MTYTSKEVSKREPDVDLNKVIIDQHIADLREEAKSERRLRVIEGQRPAGLGWPARARRRLGGTLVSAGETLRGPDPSTDPTLPRAA